MKRINMRARTLGRVHTHTHTHTGSLEAYFSWKRINVVSLLSKLTLATVTRKIRTHVFCMCFFDVWTFGDVSKMFKKASLFVFGSKGNVVWLVLYTFASKYKEMGGK